MGANFAVTQRLRLIDFLLHHYGMVGREQIKDYFGISEAQATRDFKAYRDIAPQNAVLDQSSKKYVRGAEFKRLYE